MADPLRRVRGHLVPGRRGGICTRVGLALVRGGHRSRGSRFYHCRGSDRPAAPFRMPVLAGPAFAAGKSLPGSRRRAAALRVRRLGPAQSQYSIPPLFCAAAIPSCRGRSSPAIRGRGRAPPASGVAGKSASAASNQPATAPEKRRVQSQNKR
jgi:hypothetical protein